MLWPLIWTVSMRQSRWGVTTDIRHFVEQHFVYWTISSKNLFVELSFRRMSFSSKHVSSNTFDKMFYAHPAAIIYLLVMWPRMLSFANSVLFRWNISRSVGFHSLEYFILAFMLLAFLCVWFIGVCPAMNCSIRVCFYKILGRIFIHFNVTCTMNIQQNYFIWWIIIMSDRFV